MPLDTAVDKGVLNKVSDYFRRKATAQEKTEWVEISKLPRRHPSRREYIYDTYNKLAEGEVETLTTASECIADKKVPHWNSWTTFRGNEGEVIRPSSTSYAKASCPPPRPRFQ